jgi:hypothetical protein
MTTAYITRHGDYITIHETDGSVTRWRRVAVSLPLIVKAQEETEHERDASLPEGYPLG